MASQQRMIWLCERYYPRSSHEEAGGNPKMMTASRRLSAHPQWLMSTEVFVMRAANHGQLIRMVEEASSPSQLTIQRDSAHQGGRAMAGEATIQHRHHSLLILTHNQPSHHRREIPSGKESQSRQ